MKTRFNRSVSIGVSLLFAALVALRCESELGSSDPARTESEPAAGGTTDDQGLAALRDEAKHLALTLLAADERLAGAPDGAGGEGARRRALLEAVGQAAAGVDGLGVVPVVESFLGSSFAGETDLLAHLEGMRVVLERMAREDAAAWLAIVLQPPEAEGAVRERLAAYIRQRDDVSVEALLGIVWQLARNGAEGVTASAYAAVAMLADPTTAQGPDSVDAQRVAYGEVRGVRAEDLSELGASLQGRELLGLFLRVHGEAVRQAALLGLTDVADVVLKVSPELVRLAKDGIAQIVLHVLRKIVRSALTDADAYVALPTALADLVTIMGTRAAMIAGRSSGGEAEESVEQAIVGINGLLASISTAEQVAQAKASSETIKDELAVVTGDASTATSTSLTAVLDPLGDLIDLADDADDETGTGSGTDTDEQDQAAPTAGAAISVTQKTHNTVRLAWGAATDAGSAQATLMYKVVRGGATSELDSVAEVEAISDARVVMAWTANTLSFDATGLSASTAYAFVVAVRDAAGNVAIYTPLAVTTNDPPIGSAPARPDKNLSTFVTSGTSLPVAIEHSAAIRVGDKMYLIGGKIGATPDPSGIGLSAGTTTAILEATISADGTPGAFSKSAYTLDVARKGARVEAIGSYLYVFGGYDGAFQTTTTPLASIARAPIDANGLTGSFTTHSSTLARGRYNFLTLVTPAYVYAIGGGTSDGYDSDTIERATLDQSTGEVGNFQALTRTVVSATEVTNGLVQERWTHNAIRLGDNVYILGGEGLNTIEKVVIQGDGSLGNFVKLSDTLTSARNRLSIIALNDHAYVFGGWSGTFLTTVEVAPISNDTLGAFTVSGSVTLPTGVENGTALLTDKGAFLFGGYDGSTKALIQYAPLVD